MPREAISASQARRVAVEAQGFFKTPIANTTRALLPMVRRLGTVQIDSVNVLIRSHYLPLFSRIGAYDRGALERLAYKRPRRLFEYWAHEASLVPIETYPLLRWRMERAKDGRGTWGSVSRVGLEERALVQRVRKAFESNGELSASDFDDGKGRGDWWGWTDTKRAVEYLFWSGELAVVKRKTSFERVYDLAQRVLPPDLLNAPQLPEADQQRELVRIAARAFGIATEPDLRDFFRLDLVDSKKRVAELVEAGELRPVTVEGWKQQAYLAPGQTFPRKVEGSALLSPFDSLVWNRARTHRLFDFHYRIEIYTPAHKRIHGYYVLPYLLNDALVARVDLKSDRSDGALRVVAIHFEPGVKRREVRARLRDDLRKLADWLGLERVYSAKDSNGSNAIGSR